MLKQYNSIYNTAFKILGDKTPLTTDCGALCDGACCKGGENDGMRLFPCEETTLSVHKNLCVCNGTCYRNLRPLACRIFPFFPTVDKHGNIKVKIDTRALRLCPLVENCDKIRFDKDFIKAVRRVGRLLQKHPETLRFLQETTAEIETYAKLYGFTKTYSKRK